MLMLPFAASSAGVARYRLARDLAAAGVGQGASWDAALVLTELFSNALRHARPLPGALIRVRWRFGGGTVEVSVSDGGGPSQPEPGDLSTAVTGGRGLGIVDRLSRDWGSRSDSEGTTVWAEIPVPHDHRYTGSGENCAGVAGGRQ